MSKLPIVSGLEVVKALSKLGLAPVRRRGSHVFLKGVIDGTLRFTTVPLHKELKAGTLKGILAQAGISEEDFIRRL